MRKFAAIVATGAACAATGLAVAGASVARTPDRFSWRATRVGAVYYFSPASAQNPTELVLNCPTGTYAASGGVSPSNVAASYLVDSKPNSATSWVFQIGGNSTAVNLRPWVVCIP